jgi:hypothetical protein
MITSMMQQNILSTMMRVVTSVIVIVGIIVTVITIMNLAMMVTI